MRMRQMVERERELHTAVRRKGNFPKKAVLVAPHTNEMHGHYFYPDGVINTSNTSQFEEAYATGHRYSLGFTFSDVDAVADMMRLN